MTWKQCVVAAKDRGEFTEAEVARAASWDTCAVGEQRAAMPLVVTVLSGTPWPTDLALRRLGYAFYRALDVNAFEYAETILEAIEDRTRELERDPIARGVASVDAYVM